MSPRKSSPKRRVCPEPIFRARPTAREVPYWARGLLARWRFRHKGKDYVIEHNTGSVSVYPERNRSEIPDASFGYNVLGPAHYLSGEGAHARLAFASVETRVIRESDLLNLGLGSFMLKVAENDCLAAHSKLPHVSGPLFLAGNTRHVSVLRLFLANGYKLTPEAWDYLASPRDGKRFGVECREGNEPLLLEALRATGKESINARGPIHFYKEMKELNELPS